MKTIVISGARSHVGKTTLVRHISGILKGTVCIKIGHHEPRPGKDDGFYYQKGILIDSILHNHKDARFLVIESNSILEQFDPDFCIFLDAKNPKPSAGMAIKKADIISGKRYDTAYAEKLALKTGIDNNIMRKIIWLSGARPEPVTGIVLAGGKSSRMGTDKAMLKIDGVPLAINSKDSITPFCDDVIISVNSSNAADFTGFHTVIDDVQGEGPLAGIVCSLKASSTEVNLIVACDIPYIDPRVIIRMFAETDDSDIAIPSFSSGSFEPLYGVYRKSITSIAESMLAKGQRRVSELFNRCRTKIVEMENGGRYANLNTKDDVEKYKKNLIPRPLLHHGEGEKTTKKEPFSIQALLHKSEGENTIQKELSSEMPLVHRGDGENTIKNQLNPTIFSQHNREMRISYFGEHQSPNNRTSGVTALQFVDEDKKRQSRSLRKSATAAEDILWSYLRNRKTGGFKFRRQQIIDGFIADFYCEESKLVIEVDGGVHDDENQIVIDSHRNNVFSARGIHTIRFKNNDVINHINTCLSEIIDISQRRKGLSQPLAGRRGVAEGRGEVIEEKEE